MFASKYDNVIVMSPVTAAVSSDRSIMLPMVLPVAEARLIETLPSAFAVAVGTFAGS